MCSLARFIPRISMLTPYSYGQTVIYFATKERNVGKWNNGRVNTLVIKKIASQHSIIVIKTILPFIKCYTFRPLTAIVRHV